MNVKRWWLAALAGTMIVAGACSGEDSRSESSVEPATGGAVSNGRAAAPAAPRDSAAGVSQSAGSGASAEKGGTSGSTNGGSSQQLPSVDRRIIYTVMLDMTFKDVAEGLQRISLLAEGNGGFVADSQLRRDNNQQRGSLTIRVPADRYQATLAQIRELGTVETERATSADVTEEFVDLQARQRTLEATEQSLLTLLGRATTVQEILTVQDRLTTVRADIERIKGRQNLLSRQTEYATITIGLRPVPTASTEPKSESGAITALRRGWDASLEVIGGAGRGLLTAAAFSWWLLPFVPVAIWAVRRLRRRLRQRPVRTEMAGPVAQG